MADQTEMAGTSSLLKRPQQEQQQIIHHHHHHHYNGEYVSPTYTSTPLFKPEVSPYDEKEHPPHRRHAWGTHIHQYAGIGPLTFLGSQPKTRDLYVARSHRHYLSGLSYVRHDQINKTHITPFKKALNRANDDLVPPAALIPLEKYDRIREETQLVQEDKYASHQECCEMFPQSSKETKLPEQTRNEIKKLLNKRYGQTTYSEAFYDQRKNTELTLGPQYQFYPSDSEEEEEVDEVKTGKTTETVENVESADTAGSTDTVEPSKVESEEKTDEKDKTDNEDQESSSSGAETVVECGDKAATENSDEKSQEKTPDGQASETKLQSLKELEIEAEKAKNSPDRAFWPAWPGNLSNQIQPVTLKISEKRDVCCKQDINDVRMIPVFTHHQPPDYKLFPKIQDSNQKTRPISSKDMAPAKVNFAYSGHETLYGSDAERAIQNQEKKIREMPGCSRWLPIDSNVDKNIDNILARNRAGMYGMRLEKEVAVPQPLRSRKVSTEDLRKQNSARPKSGLPELRKTTSLEELENTINGLQQPLPPLWESLQYSGDRVVDRLGVRFKSIAQQRYHQQHPERIPVALQEYLRDKVTCYKHPCRRRQYFYKGNIHMGSMFR